MSEHVGGKDVSQESSRAQRERRLINLYFKNTVPILLEFS